MNKQPMAAHVPAGPGQSNQQTIQPPMMYQNSQQPPPRVTAPVSVTFHVHSSLPKACKGWSSDRIRTGK